MPEMTKILPLAFVIILFAAIGEIILHYKFLSHLKGKHADKWKELGSPTLVINNSIKTNLATIRFLKNKEYLAMDDPKLTRISQLLWIYSISYLIFFVVVVVLFVVNLTDKK